MSYLHRVKAFFDFFRGKPIVQQIINIVGSISEGSGYRFQFGHIAVISGIVVPEGKAVGPAKVTAAAEKMGGIENAPGNTAKAVNTDDLPGVDIDLLRFTQLEPDAL